MSCLLGVRNRRKLESVPGEGEDLVEFLGKRGVAMTILLILENGKETRRAERKEATRKNEVERWKNCKRIKDSTGTPGVGENDLLMTLKKYSQDVNVNEKDQVAVNM